MRAIDGALHIANDAPHHRGWDAAQSIGSNREGVWSKSGAVDCRRVLDLEAVPGLPGAVMVAGLGAHAATGAPLYATWLTVDGGLTWSSFKAVVTPVPAEGDSIVRMMRVGADLYAVTRGSAWRWRKVLPSRSENAWNAGWERVALPDHCHVMSMETVRKGGNSTFAAWSKGPMWTFDGRIVRRMFGHLDFAMAFCTDSDDGFVYAVTRGGGVVRSHDGVRWFRHPSPAVWGATGIPAFSIAVANSTIFVGDDTSTIHAVATTAVRWMKAETA